MSKDDVSIFVHKETLRAWRQKAQGIIGGLRELRHSLPSKSETSFRRLMNESVMLEAGLRHIESHCIEIDDPDESSGTDLEQE